MRFLAVELEIRPHAALRIPHQLQKRRARFFPALVSTRDLGQEFADHGVDRRPFFSRDDTSSFEDIVVDGQGDVLHARLHSYTGYVKHCRTDSRKQLLIARV
jgi:hypothetical protein